MINREPSRTAVDRERIEDLRQVEHVVPLFVAFLLPYINRPILLGIGVIGIAYACWLSPRFVRITTRPEERNRISRAKLYYALSALCLLFVFMDRPYIGAAGFAVLAVGDALSNLVGRKLGGRPMPHNPGKTVFGSLSFWLGGGLAAWLLMLWNGAPDPPYSVTVLLVFALIGALLCAFIESLPPIVDDNLLITWVAGVVFFLLFRLDSFVPRLAFDWRLSILVGILGFAVAWSLGWLTAGGGLLAAAFGILVPLGAGITGIACLAAFLALASMVSRRGTGRPRDWLSVLSNGVVPVLIGLFCAFLPGTFLLVGFAAAVAAATCDTIGTEVGIRWNGRTVRPTSLERVPPGTPGGISVAGTLGGWVGATLVAAIPVATGWYPITGAAVVSLSALTASFFESAMKTGAGDDPFREASFNIWNTFFGAFLAGSAWYLYGS